MALDVTVVPQEEEDTKNIITPEIEEKTLVVDHEVFVSPSIQEKVVALD